MMYIAADKERCVVLGTYIVENRATVRQAARVFGISKSSVHKDMGERLPHIDQRLSDQVSALMCYNKAVRHLRGGAATKARYSRA